ncbi:hypothetical protein [Pyramidobacter sp. C12-8]|uniref:hypothetical protein n=1 Tax=Pyramidobacter sp. C12-8 TaxID=1943580 RepID=UPI00143BAA90|nr:hypothetical protein [Pyramidobacter sp. C12-8]
MFLVHPQRKPAAFRLEEGGTQLSQVSREKSLPSASAPPQKTSRGFLPYAFPALIFRGEGKIHSPSKFGSTEDADEVK